MICRLPYYIDPNKTQRWSQALITAERPCLGVGEGAVDPGQNGMGGHGVDDMARAGRRGRGCRDGLPPVLIVAPGATSAAMEPCSEAVEKSLITVRRRPPGASLSTSMAVSD
jgi:hypothetical protein